MSSDTKRPTSAAPKATPISAPLYSASVYEITTAPLTSTSKETSRHPAMLTAHPHPVTTSFETNMPSHSIAPGSVRSRTVPRPTWSPSLSRKLRWRLRQYTLWEMILSLAFISATVIFFRALAGMGYVPEPDYVASRWRVPGPGVLRRGVTATPSSASSKMLHSFQQLAAFGGKLTGLEAEGTELEGGAHSVAEEATLPRIMRNHVYYRSRFGAMPKTRQRVRRMGDDKPIREPDYVNQPAAASHDDNLSAERSTLPQAHRPDGERRSLPGDKHQ